MPAEMGYDNDHFHQPSRPSYEQDIIYPYPPRSAMSLNRPILIPSSSVGSLLSATPPFLRAYPPILDTYGVSSSRFMAIIDGLNVALAESPPFQAMQIAGNGVGFVPDHIAQGVSLGLNVAASTGAAATSYIRTKKALERANRDVFEPVGLRMEIVKDGEVMRRLNFMAKSLEPLERLQEINPHIQDLSFDVEPLTRQSNLLDRISAKQAVMKQAKKERKKQKEEDKRLLKREKAARKCSYLAVSPGESSKSGAESHGGIEDKFAELEDKMVKVNAKADAKLDLASGKKIGDIEKRRMKDLKELEKDRAKLLKEHGKALAKLNKLSDKGDKKEGRVDKLQWIMIQPIQSCVEQLEQ